MTCSVSALPAIYLFCRRMLRYFKTQKTEVSLSLAGQPFSQPPFKYQVKCYSRLKTLLAESQAPGLREVLSDTGCLVFLE